MPCVTLRIKKVFFDKILSGEKNIEYRDFKPFYEKLFNEKPSHIVFHYQKKIYLKCKVEKIRVIKTPLKLKTNSNIAFGDKVYSISLSDPKLLRGAFK